MVVRIDLFLALAVADNQFTAGHEQVAHMLDQPFRPHEMRVGAIQDNIVESFPLVAHSVLLEELDERMIRIFHACFLDHLARYIDGYDLPGLVRQQVTFQYPRAATDIEDRCV